MHFTATFVVYHVLLFCLYDAYYLQSSHTIPEVINCYSFIRLMKVHDVDGQKVDVFPVSSGLDGI